MFSGSCGMLQQSCEKVVICLRMRKRHNLEPRMEQCREYLIEAPAERRGNWKKDGRKLFLEIGCGKGSFTCALAASEPDCDFVAIEKVPDAMILAYPVITSGEHAHRGSIENLLGEDYDRLKDEVSLERFVSGDTPPAFIWHTREDMSVPAENSVLLAAELCKHSIPFELHIWQHGGHGMSLSSDQVYPTGDPNIHPECQEWIDMAVRWLKEL